MIRQHLSAFRLTLGAGVFALALSHPVLAATAAGTSISNSASVDYKVGGLDQDTVTSAPATFLVDRRIDLTVTTDEIAAIQVIPGSSGNLITFTLTNTGNDTQDFDLLATALAGGAAKFGGTDSINAASTAVYAESGGGAGYQAGSDTATFVDDLAAGSSIKIYLVASFATGLVNDAIASYHLRATAKSSAGAALVEDTDGDDPALVENVFADGDGSDDVARDAKFADFSDYQVDTATLSVNKSSSVVWDPVNLTTNPLAIPGALVEYTITIANAAGAATATNVDFSDDLSAEFAQMHYKLAAYAALKGINVQAPNLYGNSATDLTDAADADEGSYDAGTKTVTVTGIQLAGGETATVKFQVEIQ